MTAADHLDSGGALFGAFLVSGAGQLVLDHGVDGHERGAFGEPHYLMLQAAAIDADGGALFTEHGDLLIHDAAGHAH